MCEATVVNLVEQGRLVRTRSNRFVEVTFESISAYSQLALEVVIGELRTVPRRAILSSQTGFFGN